MAFRLDRATIAPPVRRADGSVVYEGPIARTGVLKYRQPDGSIRREYRPPAEVGSKKHLDSLELAHVCDDHPAERGQAKSKSVGAVGAVRFDGKNVIAKVMVRDDAVNAKIANGKRQISCGYDCVLVETPGVSPEGEPYDAIQTCHDAEHVAIVMAGRSGPEYGLRLDALESEDPEERDDAAITVGKATSANVNVTSTALSSVELDAAVAAAIATIPGAFVEPRAYADRADGTTVETARYMTPSVWIASRDLSLDTLASQLAAALGPRVTVKRGDAADPTLRQDSAAMDLAAQLAAALKNAADQQARADALEAKLKTAETAVAAEKTRADQAEAQRDAAKERADAADKARKDAADAAPAAMRARLKLEDKVAAVLGADFKVDGKDDAALQRAVAEKLLGKALPADASPAYLAARYDAAIETVATATERVDGARAAGGGSQGGTAPMTEAEAMRQARERSAARSKHAPTA